MELSNRAQQLPWTQPPVGGVSFTVPGINNVPDLHGDVFEPDLVIFFGGNQFMVLPELIAAFRRAHPDVRRVYYQTLPPGILEQQLKKGSLIVGNLRISVRPDLFVAGVERLQRLEEEGYIVRYEPYYRNRLALMVAQNNPLGIDGLEALGRAEVRISMPDRQIEGIGNKVIESYRRAGGDKLVQRIMEEKVADGTTIITQIHHRETPLHILSGKTDVGPVWVTEALFQHRLDHPLELVEIAPAHNIISTTAAGIVAGTEHGQTSAAFLSYLLTEEAAALYRGYGFQPV